MSDKHRKKPSETDGNPMPADAFREWRKRLGLKQKDAADLLGLKKRMIQYYETGSRSGKHVSIPKSIRLACYALEAGVGDYDGKDIIGEAPVQLGHRSVHRLLQSTAQHPESTDSPNMQMNRLTLSANANENE